MKSDSHAQPKQVFKKLKTVGSSLRNSKSTSRTKLSLRRPKGMQDQEL